MVSTALGGTWRAQATTDERRRAFIEAEFDASSWHEVTIPGHWSTIRALEQRSSVLHRTTFTLDNDLVDETSRHWLVFDGIWDTADVWLDGDYLGNTTTWFLKHEFDITAQVNRADPAAQHVLAVDVSASRAASDQPTRTLHGIFDDPQIVGHQNRGGIWGPVRIVSTGPVRMTKNRVVCSQANATEARLQLRSHVLSEEARAATITTTIRPPGGAPPITSTRRHDLASGTTVLEWQVAIPEPELWWPWSLGEQPLYRVSVSVEVDGSISGIWDRTVGLREITMKRFVLRVNGERLFCKGADLWPTNALPAQATADEVRRDIELARELGLDLLRVESHVARHEVYEAADRLGMLLWQDLPMRGDVKRSLQAEAVNAAHRLVDQLGAHASIAMWCAHYDPTGTTTGPRPTTTLPTRRSLFGVARQQVPTWTKSVLDRLVGRAFDVADGSRPVIQGSGSWPSAPKFDGTDTHLRFGWNNGTGRDLEAFARRIPRMVRWVSSFGAQSIPDHPEVQVLNWEPDLGLLADRYGLSVAGFRQYLPPGGFDEVDSWAEASQAYQAIVLRRQIETLRRLKYKPTGGFTFAALADCRPAISVAIHDHDRRPKQAVAAVRAACQPVIVVADRLPPELSPDDAVLLDVHVVNDRRGPLEQLEVLAHLSWQGGEHQWAWRGAVEADDVDRVGSINWMVPDAPGPVDLALTLRLDGTVIADNAYRATIRQTF